MTQTLEDQPDIAATAEAPREAAPATTEPAVSVAGRRPTFTITEAAAACAVSRKTITRKLADLAAGGAAKDDDGIWRIPVEALLSVGLHPGRSVAEEPVVDLRRSEPAKIPAAPVVADTITVSRERWDDLRIRLARAEAEASERGRALDDARLALRALTAGPASFGPEAAAEMQQRPSNPPAPGTGGQSVLGASTSVWDTLFGQPGTGGLQSDAPATPPPPTHFAVPMAPVSMPAEQRRRWWDFWR
ncbi:MAG: hypothetical protein ACOYEV_06550 [Candidatus Nanopelagicales bacterium]